MKKIYKKRQGESVERTIVKPYVAACVRCIEKAERERERGLVPRRWVPLEITPSNSGRGQKPRRGPRLRQQPNIRSHTGEKLFVHRGQRPVCAYHACTRIYTRGIRERNEQEAWLFVLSQMSYGDGERELSRIIGVWNHAEGSNCYPTFQRLHVDQRLIFEGFGPMLLIDFASLYKFGWCLASLAEIA